MLQLIGVGVCTILLIAGAAGVVAGGIKAGSGASRSSKATWQVVDAFDDENIDIGKIQEDANDGVLDQAAGLGEAAINAPSLATPGISPNPVGLGLSEGMSLGVLAAQTANDVAEGDTGPDGNGASGGEQGAGSGSSDSGDATVPDGGGAGSSDGQPVEIAEAPATHYVAWYADNIGNNPIWITTVEAYEEPEKAYDWEGGGTDPNVDLEKVALTGAYATREEASDAVYGMMSDPRTMSGVYAGLPVADIGGVKHNLEFIGGLQWWQ